MLRGQMLTAKKFAERAGVTYPTVISWLKKGLIPGAEFVEDSPLGPYWQIPVESLEKVQKQKTGPKPAKKGAKKK
jgi:predicted site-specific integrase-resolvase